jgi:hypothetical protein
MERFRACGCWCSWTMHVHQELSEELHKHRFPHRKVPSRPDQLPAPQYSCHMLAHIPCPRIDFHHLHHQCRVEHFGETPNCIARPMSWSFEDPHAGQNKGVTTACFGEDDLQWLMLELQVLLRQRQPSLSMIHPWWWLPQYQHAAHAAIVRLTKMSWWKGTGWQPP